MPYYSGIKNSAGVVTYATKNAGVASFVPEEFSSREEATSMAAILKKNYPLHSEIVIYEVQE